MSQLKRCTRRKLRAGAGKKALRAICINIRLMRGYRASGGMNVRIAEECVPADNEALFAGEQKLTECEQK